MAVDQPRCAACLIFASGRSRRRDLSLDLARQACCLCVSHLTAFSRLGGQALRTHAVRQRASQGLRRRRRSGPASSPLAGRRISAASVLISSAIGGSAAGIALFGGFRHVIPTRWYTTNWRVAAAELQFEFLAARLASRWVPAARWGEKPSRCPLCTAFGLHGSLPCCPRLPGLRGRGALALAP